MPETSTEEKLTGTGTSTIEVLSSSPRPRASSP